MSNIYTESVDELTEGCAFAIIVIIAVSAIIGLLIGLTINYLL